MTIISITLDKVTLITTDLTNAGVKELNSPNTASIRNIYDKIMCTGYITVTDDLGNTTTHIIDLIEALVNWVTLHTGSGVISQGPTLTLMDVQHTIISEWSVSNDNPLNPFLKPVETYTIEEMLIDYYLGTSRLFIDVPDYKGILAAYTYILDGRMVDITPNVNNLDITSKDFKTSIINNDTIYTVNGLVHNSSINLDTITIIDGHNSINKLNDGVVSAISLEPLGNTTVYNIDSTMMVTVNQNNPTSIYMLDLSNLLIPAGDGLTGKTVILSFMGILFYLDNFVISITNNTSIMIDSTRMDLSSIIEDVSEVLDISTVIPNTNGIVSPLNVTSLQTLYNMLDMSQTFLIVIDEPKVISKKGDITLHITKDKVKNNKNLIPFPRRRQNSNLLSDVKVVKKGRLVKNSYTYVVAPFKGKKGLKVQNYIRRNPIANNTLTFDLLYKLL